MSVFGQKRKSLPCGGMSASRPEADIGRTFPEVRFVPKGDIVSPSLWLEVHHSRVRLLCCCVKFVHTGKFNSFIENSRA